MNSHKKDDGWHPYNNIDPIKAQDIADKLLNEYWDIAESLNIMTVLWEGTCLGFVRDGGYIINDNDIDVGILESIEELTEALEANGFVRKKKYRKNWHFLKYGMLLDVCFDLFNNRFLQSFGSAVYKGRVYSTPHPVEEYLKDRYGNWKIKKLRKEWEG